MITKTFSLNKHGVPFSMMVVKVNYNSGLVSATKYGLLEKTQTSCIVLVYQLDRLQELENEI